MDDTESQQPEVEQDQAPAPEAEVESDETEDHEDNGDEFDADKAREKIRKINSENRNLRKRATEAEEKAREADGKDERLTALEAENLRLRVGVKHGLPETLIKRLSGTTEEEILQDAEELMELFGSKKPPTDQPRTKLRGGGDPTSPPEDMGDLDKFAEKVFRN